MTTPSFPSTSTASPDVLPAHMQAFANAARQHLLHPPTEWTVKRITARQWHVVDHRGATIATRTTKKAAHEAITDSTERRIWDENCAWYRGESTDTRVRPLTTDEKAIVAAVLAEKAGFVVSLNDLQPFNIEQDAFDRWITEADHLEDWLPNPRNERPGNDLSYLVAEAVEQSVLIGDPRLALCVNGDDDPRDSAGFYLVLYNTKAHKRLIGITTGWTDLEYPAEDDLSLAATARFHLEQICNQANWALGYLR